jgi:uncharacterized protein
MNQKVIINKTRLYARKVIEKNRSGHDWWHIYRVWMNARFLSKREKVDCFVIELAALLHDIADWKFHNGDDRRGPQLARKWLKSLNVEKGVIDHVCEIISGISFKGSGVITKMKSIEGEIVQDADRLDALGALGITRTFAYGGYKGREIYNPMIKPKKHRSFAQYKKSVSPTINHFYEKLLMLKDRMNTKTAKKIALERHKFMELFLRRFFKEWQGKA